MEDSRARARGCEYRSGLGMVVEGIEGRLDFAEPARRRFRRERKRAQVDPGRGFSRTSRKIGNLGNRDSLPTAVELT